MNMKILKYMTFLRKECCWEFMLWLTPTQNHIESSIKLCFVTRLITELIILSHQIPNKQLFTQVFFAFYLFCISHSRRNKVEFPPTGILESRSYEKNALEPIRGQGDQPSDQWEGRVPGKHCVQVTRGTGSGYQWPDISYGLSSHPGPGSRNSVLI